jgi:hypothetical protein
MAEVNLQPHRGPLVLVFGILGVTACLPLGIAAWWIGTKDLRAMDQGRMDPAGRDLTQAGKVCEMVGTALLVVASLWTFFVLTVLTLMAVLMSR